MSFVDSSDPSADFLSFRIVGVVTPEGMAEGFAVVRRRTEETGLNRIFFDMREVTSLLTDLDRFQIGIHAAEILGGHVRCAVVGPTGRVSRLAEDVAVNRGVTAYVTDTEEDAMQWLLGDGPSTRGTHVG